MIPADPAALPTVVRVPIVFVHPRRCMNRSPIQRGEIRRVSAPRDPLPPLIGYDVACPACGFRAIWCQRDPELIEEGPLVEDVGLVHRADPPRAFVRPAFVRSAKREACKLCRRVVALEGTEISATLSEA